MHIKVDQDRCAGCEVCVSLCPYGAIEMKEGRAVISELCQACGICLSQCPDGAIVEEKQRIEAKAEEANGVWVFAEQRHGKASPVSYELLGAGRRLADTLNTELSAVFFGYGIREQARELIAFGADKVYLSDDPVFERFQDEPYTEMLSRIIEQYMPEIVIAGATAIGRSFFPRVAARLRAGLTADCTALEIDEEKRMLLQIRPAFGGNIMATIMCPNKRPQMATVRPRVMKADKRDDSKKGVIIEVSPPHLKVRAKAVEFIKEVTTTVNLQEADVIVAGGRGLGDARNFNMLFELAEVFGGAVGASRAVVDAGWIPYSHQIGQTGKTVCPRIYIACGISGAVQHLVGMQSSDVIIAINKNGDAPIFNVATYGMVGDVLEVLPLLTKEIRQAKGL